LFRVVSNIAIDELRRQSRWRESAMLDLREAAQVDPAFLARSKAMVGSPETQLVARDHLIACFACTLGNLGPLRAAALLLKEVHGFSVDEAAEMLDATPIQVKNWLQASRAEMDKRYGETCALIAKNGVCHQCVELDEFHGAGRGDPLNGTSRSFEARLEVLRAARRAPWGRWHRMMFDLLDRLG
jgi:RNA polymerase sigma-70 factor (ECF subfamily)